MSAPHPVRPDPAPAAPATKAQAQAFRFGTRRLEHAVATGRSLRQGPSGPRPGMAYALGVVFGVLGLVGFAVYALVSPEKAIGSAAVVVDADDGGAYVVRDGHLYPALNLASALLAAGTDGGASGGSASAQAPTVATVGSATLATMPKGPTFGIDGAPTSLPGESDLVPGGWTVCDRAATDPGAAPTSSPHLTTTVGLGVRAAAPAATGLPGALVQLEGSDQVYLVWGGRRSLLGSDRAAVDLALGLGGATPRPISAGLLNAIPPGADLSPPSIDRYGSPIGWDREVSIGTVFQVQFADGPEFFVVLDDGAERVPRVVGDLIRANHQASSAIPSVPLAVLKQAPTSTQIDLGRFPAVRPTLATVSAAPALCTVWTGGDDAGAHTVFPTPTLPAPLAGAVPAPPGAAPGSADAVSIAPGRGAVYGQVTGDQRAANGALFLVTDQGVKYPVVSRDALTYLRLGDLAKVSPASSALLDLIPTGPTLDPTKAAAFVPAAGGEASGAPPSSPPPSLPAGGGADSSAGH